MTMGNKDKEEKILYSLKNSKKSRGLSIKEISDTTNLCRNTISKYIGILEVKNEVVIDTIGNVKLISINKTNNK